MIRRLLIALRLGRRLPRCGAPPPWRLADAGPCIIPAGHETSGRVSAAWHADGNGYIWNATEWRWMGPLVDLAPEYRSDPARTPSGFEEETWLPRPLPDPDCPRCQTQNRGWPCREHFDKGRP
jgi:hypothetical protein